MHINYSIVTLSVISLGVLAQPTRKVIINEQPQAPVAFDDSWFGKLGTVPASPPSSVPQVVINPRADRDARRDEHRKEWQEWAHQTGENGRSNGSNFISEILGGVSGIVDSALSPVNALIKGN